MKLREITCKSVLTKSKLPEVDYCINPYTGCMHSCIYCYACFMRRFTGHLNEDWGAFVDIKTNAPFILEKELKCSRSNKKGIALLGSVTDAYQPVERHYQLTRKILKILLEHNFSISILKLNS